MNVFKRVVRVFMLIGAFTVGAYVVFRLVRLILGVLLSRLPSLIGQGPAWALPALETAAIRPWAFMLVSLTMVSLVLSVHARRALEYLIGQKITVPEFSAHYRGALRFVVRKLLAIWPTLLGLAITFSFFEWVFQAAVARGIHEAFMLLAWLGFWGLIVLTTWILFIYVGQKLDKLLPEAGSGAVSQTLMLGLLVFVVVSLFWLNFWLADIVLLAFGLFGVFAFLAVIGRVVVYCAKYALGKKWHLALGRQAKRWITA